MRKDDLARLMEETRQQEKEMVKESAIIVGLWLAQTALYVPFRIADWVLGPWMKDRPNCSNDDENW